MTDAMRLTLKHMPANGLSMTPGEMCVLTGLDDKTQVDALEELEAKGKIVANRTYFRIPQEQQT